MVLPQSLIPTHTSSYPEVACSPASEAFASHNESESTAPLLNPASFAQSGPNGKPALTIQLECDAIRGRIEGDILLGASR